MKAYRQSLKTLRIRLRSPQSGEFRELSLIHFLRDQGQPQFRRGGLNAISSDQTLSPPRRIRQRALQFARDWKP